MPRRRKPLEGTEAAYNAVTSSESTRRNRVAPWQLECATETELRVYHALLLGASYRKAAEEAKTSFGTVVTLMRNADFRAQVDRARMEVIASLEAEGAGLMSEALEYLRGLITRGGPIDEHDRYRAELAQRWLDATYVRLLQATLRAQVGDNGIHGNVRHSLSEPDARNFPVVISGVPGESPD